MEISEAVYLRERQDEIIAKLSEAFWLQIGPEPTPAFPDGPSLTETLEAIGKEDDDDLYTCWEPVAGESIEDHDRHYRDYDANLFRAEYKFVWGIKSCISSKAFFSYGDDKCFDKNWVAIHGFESICMVTRRQAVDMLRVEHFYQQYCTDYQTMRSYAEAILSEVECMKTRKCPAVADCDPVLSRVEKPFGVVSVVSDKEHGNEASVAATYDVSKANAANAILTEKMKSGMLFTVDETVQTAIKVFQCLCVEEMKAKDFWVSTLSIPKNRFFHLGISEVEKHLATIGVGSSSRSKD